ncbi:MAG: hypothetical protein ABIK32_06535 [Chloroflexota bacterium]|nr:serine protease [Chloroflexota bacterium]
MAHKIGDYKNGIFHAGVLPNMLVDNQFLKCVSFLLIDRQNPDTLKQERIPIATAFFVSMPIINDYAQIYAVTARHVIYETARGNLYLRLKSSNDDYEDVVVLPDNWICHPKTDVAVIPIEIPDKHDCKIIPLEALATEKFITDNEVSTGDDVFFVGLFTAYSGQKHDRPIVRFGNISLMKEEIPLKLVPGSETKTLVDAYLVESRSWGGQSGSPAFVYFPVDREPGIIKFGGQQFALLGLTHGHYNITQDVKFAGDILGSGKVPINAGIALVIPADKIIETLMEKQLLEERERDLIKYQNSLSSPTPDITYPIVFVRLS